MRLGEEGQIIGRKSRHIPLTCAALDLTGRALYHQGDFKQGQQLLEESLALSRKLGNQQDLIDKLDRLGLIAYYEGDYQRATDLLEKALTMSQAPEYEVDRAVVQSTYAAVILGEEQPARARALLVESLPSLQQSGMKWFIIRALEILAAVDLAEFHPVRAVHLFGVASAARQILGAPLPPPERPAYERVVQLAREQLGDEEFTVAWEEGCRMTLNQAVSYALTNSID
jgi:tetratricopeptide (TPR) repeat protein